MWLQLTLTIHYPTKSIGKYLIWQNAYFCYSFTSSKVKNSFGFGKIILTNVKSPLLQDCSMLEDYGSSYISGDKKWGL